MPIRRLEKTYTGTTSTIGGDEIAASTIPVKPHIQPGVLQPAVDGKLLNGATHSGAYGTTQADGHKYYYTFIKGSKSIKDPRIGAHFGSQRHWTTEIQQQAQETAAHGRGVWTIDGREWMRCVDGDNDEQNYWKKVWDAQGGWLSNGGSSCDDMVLEITGYFNDINWLTYITANNTNDVDIKVNGTMSHEGHTTITGVTVLETPLKDRYVKSGSLINFGSTVSASLGTTPAINTITITFTNGDSEYFRLFGVELIAQDTTSTANKSKIQIPAQNVVSYGKKFALSAAAHHYDPFNGFTNGTTTFGTKVDTATSLGLGEGTTWGAPWAISSSNHIRPFNGGRVVKWIASDGTIKTSVTMMPRNAQARNQTAVNEISPASATNAHVLNLSDDAIESSLAEEAKHFLLKEFGNGAANAGQNTSATWQDASMVEAEDGIAFVMDDGLTSLSCTHGRTVAKSDVVINADAKSMFITFIGTGISMGHQTVATHAGSDDYKFYIDGVLVRRKTASSDSVINNREEIFAQNLPYGTHIFKIERTVASNVAARHNRITIFQPKKPPIPDDACIIADYMLMADLVVQTAGEENISKGVRMQSHSRDIFVDAVGTTGTRLFSSTGYPMGLTFDNDGVLTGGGASRSVTQKLPYFGTDFLINHYANRIGTVTENLNSDAGTSTAISTSGNDGLTKHIGNALGVNEMKAHITNGQNDDRAYTWASFYHTPTHTSSHYQTFETSFAKELVGGDRNMEQTNLVVTADGKTWDEVTRDTSYIGSICVQAERDTENTDGDGVVNFDEWRGYGTGDSNSYGRPLFTKDFTPFNGGLHCLVDGWYRIHFHTYVTSSCDANAWANIKINGQIATQFYVYDAAYGETNGTAVVYLKRMDYVQVFSFMVSHGEAEFHITRL